MANQSGEIVEVRRRGVGFWAGLALGVIGMLLLVTGVLWLRHAWLGPRISINQAAVVRQIQALKRLETMKYTADKIIAGERNSKLLPDFLAGDKLLLVVHGEIVAGVDLGKLKSGDVQVNAKSVHLKLPVPEVFSTRIDSGQTRVFSRQTGVLVQGDPNLESDLRKQAEKELEEAALNNGILQSAQANARSTMSSLLKGLGFEQVVVD